MTVQSSTGINTTIRSALLVDPDSAVRQSYSLYLRRADCDVEEAWDGRDALAKAISHPHDVIVTETRLPGIDGLSLCDLLKHDAALQRTSILFVTGSDCAADLDHARRVGADGILIKPCLPEVLLLEMQRVIRHSHELQARSELIRSRVGEQLARADRAVARSTATVRATLSRSHRRGDTTAPPIAPPDLRCPSCDRRLVYQRSHIGGVNERNSEQWDYFECAAGCGMFQFRQRTRRLRQVS
jgi:DNA-binding response OmpR family regulator